MRVDLFLQSDERVGSRLVDDVQDLNGLIAEDVILPRHSVRETESETSGDGMTS